jgi:hypothetical protein
MSMPTPDITRSAKSGVQCSRLVKMARHSSSHLSKLDSLAVMTAPRFFQITAGRLPAKFQTW